MVARGPNPKPTEAKRRAGNPGHRPLNPNEPDLPLELPKCPSYLNGRARYQWRVIGKALIEARLMTAIDETALAALCQAKSDWVTAIEKIGAKGAGYEVDGLLKKNPWVAVKAEAWKEMSRMMAEFGMTPSSRSRVSTKIKTKQGDGEKWFGINNRN